MSGHDETSTIEDLCATLVMDAEDLSEQYSARSDAKKTSVRHSLVAFHPRFYSPCQSETDRLALGIRWV